MRRPEFETLEVTEMASGHKCLNLTEQTSWEDFPTVADKLLREIGGVIEERVDTVPTRLWKLRCRGVVLDLVFDDFPLGASSESNSAAGDMLIQDLCVVLRERGVKD
jgi:hypothetical protein